MASLHDPLPLPCGLILPNRIMKSALSESLGTAGHAPDERLIRLYGRWGEGGFGLIVTGNVMIDRTQLGEPGNVAVTDERDLDALTRWAKAAKQGGAHVWMQVNHPGRQANPLAARHRPVAPSAIAPGIPGMLTPRALTEAEIADLIQRFATTARVAETAGFDGVQIHGAHGYLLSQFLSPLSNRRTDDWGGDPARRMRFALEVVRSIRGAVRPEFAVSIKLNSADFQRGGFSETESRAVLEALSPEGLDLIEISGGSYESPAMMGATGGRDRDARKLAILLWVNRHVMNPTVRGLDRIGIRTTFATQLETIGRKSGQPRRVPVTVRFDDTGAWLICQHGTASGWGSNVAADPNVRVRQGTRWRIGTAELRPDDDLVARARSFAPLRALAPLTAAGFAALQTTAVSVRITFTDTGSANPSRNEPARSTA